MRQWLFWPIADIAGEINEAGGVLTFFIPAKTYGDDD